MPISLNKGLGAGSTYKCDMEVHIFRLIYLWTTNDKRQRKTANISRVFFVSTCLRALSKTTDARDTLRIGFVVRMKWEQTLHDIGL